MRKFFFIGLLYIFMLVIAIPCSITFLFNKFNQSEQKKDIYIQNDYETKITPVKTDYIIVYDKKSGENKDLENYIKGVVAAEMPVSFEKEALKAQAVAARTYTIREIGTADETKIDASKIGQAYITIDEMKERWKDKFDEYYKKVCDAVDSTNGEIMVYNDEPILAAFHSTSAGITESSENVWSGSLPYLKSVDSSIDKNAPDFISTKKVSISTFINTLKGYNVSGLTKDNIKNNIKIVSRTNADYVKSISIGGKNFEGTEIRKIFGLRSANFTISYDENNIIFTTKGYGHGAGMSQYGAEFMAKEGKSYHDILSHYYTGISFSKY